MTQVATHPLVEESRRGNSQAQLTLWEFVGEKLRIMIWKSFPSLQDADVHSIALEAFAEGLASLHKFRGDATFVTWVMSIARKIAIDHLTRLKKATHEVPLDSVPEEAIRPRWTPRPARIDPEEVIALLRDVWLLLTHDQLEVVLLRLHGGLRPQDAADRLGRSLKSVKRLFDRAVVVLRRAQDARAKGLDPFDHLCA